MNVNYEIKSLDYVELKNQTKLPSFQRSVVWSSEKRKELIHTIQDGYPFGSLLLHETLGAEKKYLLVDGLQRLSTIMDYEKNKYAYIDIQSFAKEYFEEIYALYESRVEASLSDSVKNKIMDIVVNAFKRKTTESGVTFITRELVTEMPTFDSFQLDVMEIIEKIDSRITNYIDLDKLRVPVVIFKGDASELPNIFESINSGGTKLSKYEIFASAWQGIVFKIDDATILRWVDEKYEKMQEKSGLEIENYTPGSIAESGEINLFEYAYAIGKIIRNDYVEMFAGKNSSDASEIDAIGFGLLAAALGVDIKKMGNIANHFRVNMDPKNLIDMKDKLVECSREVNDILKKYIKSVDNKVFTKYMYHQVVSIVASLFKIKYSVGADLKISTNHGSTRHVRSFERHMPKHYLYDLIRGFWAGSGDTKIAELLRQDIEKNKYIDGISDEWWTSALEEWMGEQEKKESRNIDIVNKLFLTYMFNLTNPAATTNKYDFEHIIPQNRFERRFGKGPFSAVGNLCILPLFENRSKKEKTLYEYFDETLSTGNINEAEIQNNYYYPQRSEIDFIKGDSFTKDAYARFLRERHYYLSRKFIELISRL